MVVYADVVFLLNLIVDYCILLVTAVALKRNVKKWRLLLGALIGSGSVLLNFTSFEVSDMPLIKLLISLIMVFVSFGYINTNTYVKNLLMFYFSTFLFGGSVIGIHYLLQSEYPKFTEPISSFSSVYGDPISWVFVVVAVPILHVYIRKQVDEISFTKLRYDKIIKVEVEIKNFLFELTGLIDNGNGLVDPITGKPIIIVTEKSIRGIVPEDILALASTPLDGLHHISDDWKNLIGVVPIKVVGLSQQWLLTLRAKKIKMYTSDDIVEVSHVLIGVNPFTFTDQDEFQCILHPKLLVG